MSGSQGKGAGCTGKHDDNYHNYENCENYETFQQAKVRGAVSTTYDSLNFSEAKVTQDRKFLSSKCGRIACIVILFGTAIILAVGISILVSWFSFHRSNQGSTDLLHI